MANEISVKLGTKLTSDEQLQIDASMAAPLRAQPSRDAVQAQFGGVVLCPHCGGIGYKQEINPNAQPGFYLCNCCGLMYKA